MLTERRVTVEEKMCKADVCVCVHVVSQLLVAKHVPGFICKASIMWYAAYALLGERYVTGIREREKERERARERESWKLFWER